MDNVDNDGFLLYHRKLAISTVNMCWFSNVDGGGDAAVGCRAVGGREETMGVGKRRPRGKRWRRERVGYIDHFTPFNLNH